MKRKYRIFLLLVGLIFLSLHRENVCASENVNQHSQNISEEINLKDAIVSKPMTFDQLVYQYAKDADLSEQEARKVLNADSKTQSSSDMYSNNTYRTISTYLNVTSTYKPQLRYYCQTSEYKGGWHGIVKIMTVNMYREYNGKTFSFGGSIYSHLVDANRIFYIVNGDFYKNGTTTYNGGVNIQVGGKSTINFSASYTGNHYKYFYVENNLRW